MADFSRYICWALTLLMALAFYKFSLFLSFLFFALFLLGLYNFFQSSHSILRNYPVIGYFRFALEYIRPEIRQYFLESDEEELPFSRNQRAMVYSRSKNQNDKRGFGTIRSLYEGNVAWLVHSSHPLELEQYDFRVTIGGPECLKPYSASLFNISAMSFGALSANAIRALNRGAKLGGFAHDTGEGSISPYHREEGGDIIWELGSGYFGCRTEEGRFSDEKFQEQIHNPQIKMVEIKLSQGAKPGHGGVLPGAKVSAEIALTRGVVEGKDCVSPASHPEFSSPLGLIDFISRLRLLSSGKPVGFKLCVGQAWDWFGIAKAMKEKNIYPDFIVIDGSEGGTGAAPVEFTDHVGMPMLEGLNLVHNTLRGLGIRDRIKIGVSGKIISGFDIVKVLALGADWCNTARGFMFALGCIQSRNCHTDHCPTGVATQNKLRQKALVVTDKAQRVSNFHHQTLKSVAELVGSAGLNHPSDLTPDYIMVRDSQGRSIPLSETLTLLDEGCLMAPDAPPDTAPDLFKRYWKGAQIDKFGYKA